MSMRFTPGALLIGILCAAASPRPSGDVKPAKWTFMSGGSTRTAFVYVPEKAVKPAPLLLLLHGSGHDGKSLIDPWQPLARAEGIVLVAPDASNPQAWRVPQEGPQDFHDLVEALRAQHPEVDPRRMHISVTPPGRFMASIWRCSSRVTSPPPPSTPASSARRCRRSWPRRARSRSRSGSAPNDAFFPVRVVRNTRDVLTANGFDVTLTEIPNHTHDYYGSSSSINKDAWAFLQKQHLDADPEYQAYQLVPVGKRPALMPPSLAR